MNALLSQGLILTVLGMGMTFLSLGALVAGMYLMTTLIQDQPQKVEPAPMPELEPEDAADDARYLAAAAAVAIALEQAAQEWQPSMISGSTPAHAWNTQVRQRQLTQRQQHALRRGH